MTKCRRHKMRKEMNLAKCRNFTYFFGFGGYRESVAKAGELDGAS